MKIRLRTVLKVAGIAVALLLAAGIAAPTLSDRYGEKLRLSLESALGRPVEFQGPVRFSLFQGPGLSVERVIIRENPGIGIEPIAYVEGGMEVAPSFWSLLGGRFVVDSIRLEDASINLVKTGPADGPGRWNFASLVNRSVMSAAPAIHVRNGRINFKFGDVKSVFYLTETDLDIAPPSAGRSGWAVYCSAKPARTDRTAQGLGSFTIEGHWFVTPERVDLDLEIDRAGLGELTALMRGQSGSVHGTVSSRLHLGGPIDNIGIRGRVQVEDVHRWDLLPPGGSGWPFAVSGRLNLVGESLELQSVPPGDAPMPLWIAFRANNYLSQPTWAATLNWNRFPVAPILELARHMGVQTPPRLQLSGTLDGAIGYSSESSFQGELAFHDAAVAIPDTPPVRFDQAHVMVDRGHVHLDPTLVHTPSGDEAHLEADYALDDASLDLAITADAMKIEALRAQVALAAVPWLDQIRSGQWSGVLRYHQTPLGPASWTGRLNLTDAGIPVPGLADPVQLASARVQIDGPRVTLDRLQATLGKLAFTGEYHYEPAAARPHRLRVRALQVDAADLEDELLPTLRRTPGLIARALGRTAPPAWLKQRALDGAIQIDTLRLAGARLDNFRARLLWNGSHAELADLRARLGRAAVNGTLAIALDATRPSYKFTGQVKGLAWQSGTLDAEGTFETSGIRGQLLTRLASQGTFSGTALDLGSPPLRAAAGEYALNWIDGVPHWQLTGLTLRTEDQLFTGRGATQDDGQLVIVLTNGSREMRMSGTVARLRVEEPPRPEPVRLLPDPPRARP